MASTSQLLTRALGCSSKLKQLAAISLGSVRNASSSTEVNTSRLDQRVAIITGSTEGIGYAVADRMLSEGAKVVISSRKQVNVDKALATLKERHCDRVGGLVCHVGKEEDRNRLIEYTLQEYGKIDILISNVAVNPYFGSLLDMDEGQWDKIFDVNVKAPFMLTKSIVPHMLNNKREGDNGAIIYISSIAAYSGMSAIGAYSISKTALLGLCKNASMELAKEGIRVNLVAPGVIKTKFSNLLWEDDGQDEYFKSMTHMKRLGEARELGGVVSFLASPDASYITGENIVVAGGYHCGL